MTAFSAALAFVVDGVPPGHRGCHPDGLADASGFAAMGCDELLVHTWDAARGLGLDFQPPSVLSQMVLRRLFPWAPEDTDPWPTLLWANGRAELTSCRDKWTGAGTARRCPNGTAYCARSDRPTDRPALTGLH